METNRAPTIDAIADHADHEGDVISFVPTAGDPEGDDLTWSATGLPAGISINPVTGEIEGGLGFATAGIYTVTVIADDDGLPSLTATTRLCGMCRTRTGPRW